MRTEATGDCEGAQHAFRQWRHTGRQARVHALNLPARSHRALSGCGSGGRRGGRGGGRGGGRRGLWHALSLRQTQSGRQDMKEFGIGGIGICTAVSAGSPSPSALWVPTHLGCGGRGGGGWRGHNNACLGQGGSNGLRVAMCYSLHRGTRQRREGGSGPFEMALPC